MKKYNLKKTCRRFERSTWRTTGECRRKLRMNTSSNLKLKELRNNKMTWTNGELRFAISR